MPGSRKYEKIADFPAGEGAAAPLPATTLYVHLRPDGRADLENFGCCPSRRSGSY